jgi:hypothetical protein
LTLIGVCKKNFSLDPFNGALFLFYNKSKTSFKILFYDGEGFILYLKRLSAGKFQYKPESKNNLSYMQIGHRALQILISNGDLNSVKFGKEWRPIKPHT